MHLTMATLLCEQDQQRVQLPVHNRRERHHQQPEPHRQRSEDQHGVPHGLQLVSRSPRLPASPQLHRCPDRM